MAMHPLNIPEITLGTWAWGDSGETRDGYFGSLFSRNDLEEVVDRAHAVGFTLWDTAHVYGMGHSETVLGEVLKRYERRKYQISTKFTPQAAGTGANPVTDMLQQSLARLRTDYIDLYWIHNPADVARWTPYLIPLLQSGKVKHVGVSNHNLAEIKLANQILGEAGFQIEAVQNHYSLLYRDAENTGILEYCHNCNIPFFAYMVLEQGALTGHYSPEHPLPNSTDRGNVYNRILPQLNALTNKLIEIGRAQYAAAPDIATAWALAKGVTPIIGVTKPFHIDGLARARSITLSNDHIADLENLADAANVNTRGWWEKEMLP